MGIIRFIWEIIKKYLGLIITLLIIYIMYKSYYTLDGISVKGEYYTLYNTLGKAINFVFDRIPKMFVEIPQFNIPKFGYMFNKIGSIPDIPDDKSISINKPNNCGIEVPNLVAILNPMCSLEYIEDGGKMVIKTASEIEDFFSSFSNII